MPQQPLILLLRPHPVEIGSLSEAGIVAAIPVLRVVPNQEALREILERLDECDWLVLTSPRAPRMLRSIREHLLDATRRGLRLAVVGPRTAERLRAELGLEPSLVPESYTGASLAEELVKKHKPGCVLLARSEKATPELLQVLQRSGIRYYEIPLYRVEKVEKLTDTAARIADDFDYVVFTSPSVAEAFFSKYHGEPGFTPVAIGPTTARKLVQLGIKNPLVPSTYTLEGIAELITRHWASKGADK